MRMPSLWPWLLRRPRWVLTASLALTGFLAWHLRNLDFDSSPSTLILSGSPEIEYYERMTRVFGSDRVLLIGIRVMDALGPETLQKTRNLTYELERIPGVTRVLSLTNVADVRGGEDEVSIAPLVPEDLGAIDKEALRARLQANPLYEKNLVSRDLRMASLIVFLEDPGQGAALARGREITRSVRAVVGRAHWDSPVILGGIPEMELEGTENMIRDFRVFTPVTLVLIAAILIASFRSLRGLLLPLSVSGLALAWTLGVLVWSGRPLKVTTLVLPSLLVSNGCSYAIHFLAQYYRSLASACGGGLAPDRKTHQAAVLETLKLTHTAIFISAITTMAGFGSLAFNRIPAISDLGLFAAMGVFLSYVFCITVSPAALSLLPPPKLHNPAGNQSDRLKHFLERLAEFDIRRRRWIHFIALAASAWAVWGIFRIEVHTNYLGYFHKSAPVVRAAQEFHEQLAGISPLSIIIETPRPQHVTDPGVLRAADRLQLKLASTPGVDLAVSFVDILKVLNRAFHSEDPRHFTLPTDPEAIQELTEFAESDPGGLSADFLSEDRKLLRIFARTNLFDSSEIRHLLDVIQEEGARVLPPGTTVHATGTLALMNETSDRVAAGQVKSLALSVLLIALIVILLFRSWKIGCLAMIPTGIPILLFFGLMGWSGLSLNVNTSMIANIAIGIAVDNCVHYLVHFRKNRGRGASTSEITQQSLASVGGAMISAATALALGFLVFGLSRFEPVAQFGYLAAFIMATNLAADIFLLPSLMCSK